MKNKIMFAVISFVVLASVGCGVHEDTTIMNTPQGNVTDQRISTPTGSKRVRTVDTQKGFNECMDDLKDENGQTVSRLGCSGMGMGVGGFNMPFGMGFRSNPNQPMNDPYFTPGMQAAGPSFGQGLAPVGPAAPAQGNGQTASNGQVDGAQNKILKNHEGRINSLESNKPAPKK